MTYLSRLDHKPGAGIVLFHELLQAVSVRFEKRHGQIAGQDVVKRRDISGTLDRSVAAQGEDAAARPPDVAQQQLKNRRGADDLHTLSNAASNLPRNRWPRSCLVLKRR